MAGSRCHDLDAFSELLLTRTNWPSSNPTRDHLHHCACPLELLTHTKRGTRGNRDSRVTKSEPIPRTDHLSDLRPTRNVVSTNGDAGGSSGKLVVNREASDSGRPSNASKDSRDTGSERFAERDRAARDSDWTPPEDSGGDARGARASEAGRGASTTVYGLLSSGKGLGREGFGREEAESTQRVGADSRGRTGGDELGGESTFLAAHPTDSGFTGLEGGAWALRRGAY